MSDQLTTRKADGVWVVRAGGAVLAESRNAVELSEGGLPPVIYFPRDDIAMAFLDDSSTRTTCPHKGQATYFSIQTKSETLTDAAWSYEAPTDAAQRIKGHLAFYSNDKVAVEQL